MGGNFKKKVSETTIDYGYLKVILQLTPVEPPETSKRFVGFILSERSVTHTLPETNIAPENGPSQKESSLPTIHFQGLC